MQDLKLVEIADVRDDLLPAWLELYDIAFPPEEKVLASVFVRSLQEKAQGLLEHSHMLAALDSTGKLLGLGCFEALLDSGVAALWYLAVAPEVRRRGYGTAIHQEMLRMCREAGAKAAVMEIEIPDETADAGFAQIRIDFNRRHGALMLQGVRYLQYVGRHQMPINMHLMLVPFTDITPQEAFDYAREVFGKDWVTQVGELGLE
jgi:GNAT superfamily N-acetyltransferase